ncbi:unnamed protein product [Linum tenue]|uniref:F-box domain-containing protein n=1 Tax=Linum tenue TaxID=586396 RepID=A0AAV0JBI0_9ROSI|nr:unnamed protein product [Linum tenue]
MDPTIWNTLPEELLDHILTFISLETLLNLRSTCKRFDSLFLSPSFISKYNSSPNNNNPSQHFPSFLLLAHPHFGPNRFAVYDSLHGRRWRNFHLPISTFLPRSTITAGGASSTLLASSKGILCFSRPSSPSSFLVCNLLTRSNRVVKFPNYPFPTESLTLIPTRSSGYKIFAICRGSGISSRSSFVYDSALHCWHQGEAIASNLRSNNRREEGVIHGSSLYFSTVDPYSIVRYDLEQRKWDDGAQSIDGTGRLSFMRLVGDGELKMYLIAGVAAAQSILTGLKIWELNDGRNWVELGDLPREMCRKFAAVCYHNYERVNCLWHEGMIFVCCYTWPEILWYDVLAGEWGWLPKCPLLPQKKGNSCGFTWFSVVPQLYTLV